jgi:hypothetical protein
MLELLKPLADIAVKLIPGIAKDRYLLIHGKSGSFAIIANSIDSNAFPVALPYEDRNAALHAASGDFSLPVA